MEEDDEVMRTPRSLRVVIKLGTSSIVDEKTHEPILSILTLIVETAVKLRKDGHKVIIVSSGAIGVGLRRMDVEKRPKHLAQLQALAAIGQCRLMSLWDSLFNHLRQPIAQILLTRSDIADRTRYLNAQNTFSELLDMGVIPVVNENDTLAVSEIKFGDNDTLSAITAAMVHADMLFLMTDVDCLYDKNPRTNPDARPIEVIEDIGSLVADVSTAGSSLGTGGMFTKIVAARLATSAGVTAVITRSSNPGNILKIVRHVQASRSPPSPVKHPEDQPAAAEESLSRSTSSLRLDLEDKIPLHTRFLPSPHPIKDRSFWVLHGLAPHGTIYIDTGAHKALVDKAGLLPVGVVDVEGTFAQQEAVRICVVERRRGSKNGGGGGSRSSRSSSSGSNDHATTNGGSEANGHSQNGDHDNNNNHHDHAKDDNENDADNNNSSNNNNRRLWDGPAVEVGRALANYSATEIARIKGHQSTEIESLLGYADSEYVTQREHVCVFRKDSRPPTPTPMRDLLDRQGLGGYESETGILL